MLTAWKFGQTGAGTVESAKRGPSRAQAVSFHCQITLLPLHFVAAADPHHQDT